MEPEARVDALQEDPACFSLSIEDEHTFGAGLARGQCGPEAGGTATGDDHVVGAMQRARALVDHVLPPADSTSSRSSTSHEPAPRFVTALNGTPSSRESTSMQRAVQNPPWHLPIPARVRNFKPSRVRAPAAMASRISPSVTSSQ